MTKKKHIRNNKKKDKPFVSICTPTFNRRPFFDSCIKCFNHQIYPKELIEWIIIDDGTDPVEDLVKDIPQVKYFKYDTKMSLGKKRNLMHEKSKGDILVYMDDDDYYPPERVSHAVEMLQQHPKCLCAGSSEIYIYFEHIDKVYQFGPYGPNHATAGTFAFKRRLLEQHKYNDEAALAEERAFLKDYTVPFIQLDPKKVILVFSHEHNTFDKKKLLQSAPNDFCKPSDKKVEDFVKQEDLKNFYMKEIHETIKDYAPGRTEMKPDVIKQTKEIEERRAKDRDNAPVYRQNDKGDAVPISNKELVDTIHKYEKIINECVVKTKDPASGQITFVPANELIQSMQNTKIEVDNLKKGQLEIYTNNNGQDIKLTNDQIMMVIKKMQYELAFYKQHSSSHPPPFELHMQQQQNQQDMQNEMNNDIELIVNQCEVTAETAVQYLKENNGDVVDTIMKIENDKENGIMELNQDDIKLVITQCNVTMDVACKNLKKNNGDVIETVMELMNVPNASIDDEESGKNDVDGQEEETACQDVGEEEETDAQDVGEEEETDVQDVGEHEEEKENLTMVIDSPTFEN